MSERALDWVGFGLLCIAIWSIAGVVVALGLDNPDAAWKFVAGLVGSGVTLVGLNLYSARRYG